MDRFTGGKENVGTIIRVKIMRFEAVEYATLEWVDWFNNRRLLEPNRKHSASKGRSKLRRNSGKIRDGCVA